MTFENNSIQFTAPEGAYTIPYILQQIATIQADIGYVSAALEQLSKISDGNSGNPGSPGDIAGEAKAKAIRDVIIHREETNQQLLRLYEKMYDDLTSRPEHNSPEQP